MFLLILFLLPASSLAAKKEKSLVGEETPYFSLPSTQDRLISYVNDYYGKHHLIITFFPAAFTPV
jgi:peroxiredoxin